eukprot:7815643-Pyramimonas_sp.AAC.2
MTLTVDVALASKIPNPAISWLPSLEVPRVPVSKCPVSLSRKTAGQLQSDETLCVSLGGNTWRLPLREHFQRFNIGENTTKGFNLLRLERLWKLHNYVACA